jgi:cob(I)alamin adenosyltransferase
MASITTRTGDDGTTSLLYGQRVAKYHPQVEAVGACDELNVALGAARLHGLPAATDQLLRQVQENLIALMGEVACAEADAARFAESKFSRVEPADVARLDAAIAAIEAKRPPAGGWATPGASPAAVALDQARVAARRAERRIAALSALGRKLRAPALEFSNRLSDLLWLLAREAERGA